MVTRTSGGVVTAEGEYMEPGARLEIPGPGGVTAVDTDGRIVLIGESGFSLDTRRTRRTVLKL